MIPIPPILFMLLGAGVVVWGLVVGPTDDLNFDMAIICVGIALFVYGAGTFHEWRAAR